MDSGPPLHPASRPARLPQSRLAAFRSAHPDVDVNPGLGFWGADYRSPDGRIAFKARHKLTDLLDELEEELG